MTNIELWLWMFVLAVLLLLITIGIGTLRETLRRKIFGRRGVGRKAVIITMFVIVISTSVMISWIRSQTPDLNTEQNWTFTTQESE